MEKSFVSIKHKLMQLGMVTSIITLLMVLIVFSSYSLYSSKNSLENELKLLSKLISKRAASALVWEDPTTVHNSLKELSIKNSINLSCIYNNNKEIYAHYSRSGINKCPKTLKESIRNKEINLNNIQIYNPILFNDSTVGHLIIESNFEDIYNYIYTFLLFITLLIIPSILFSYIISNRYKNYIAQPILHLVATTKKIVEERNYSARACKHSNDEIGILTDSFNEMMHEVQSAKSNLEQKVAERTADLRKTLHDLEKALEAKSSFLANMSHEIRTPIHGIRNFLGFLIKDWETTPEEKRIFFVEKTYKASSRLLDLINNLLDLSKLDAHEMEFEFANYDLVSLVQEHITESEALIGDKDISFTFIPPEAKSIHADFDTGRISQVIVNLIGNAVKYSNDGNIEVSLKQETCIIDSEEHNQEAVSFIISDEGVGIPEEELEHIFDKFAESSHTKSQAGGTGLGLSICQEIIHAHNGKIWAKNNPKKGSTFTFTIPIHHKIENM